MTRKTLLVVEPDDLAIVVPAVDVARESDRNLPNIAKTKIVKLNLLDVLPLKVVPSFLAKRIAI